MFCSEIATFHCRQDAHSVWHSPPNAPFGGIAISETCKFDELEFFLDCIFDWIRSNCGKKLVIKSAPACYDPAFHELSSSLYISTGFCPIRTLLNHFIPIGSENFSQLLHASEKRRLHKSQKAGFTARLEKNSDRAMHYTFLDECNTEKGYMSDLRCNEVFTLLTRFPNDFLVFIAKDGNLTIAAALVVRVSNTILYIFRSAFLPAYKGYSPIVLLTAKIYEFCQEHTISILDLGTSLDHLGSIKPELVRFKKNLGGKECLKVTYEKHFD